MEHEKEELQEILETFLREIGELTGVLQDYDFSSVYTIHEEYRGDGWGKATPECVQQIYELAQTEGIYVEQVYTYARHGAQGAGRRQRLLPPHGRIQRTVQPILKK